MSHEPYQRTNQKLHFAGLALQAWRAAEASTALNARAQAQAEREAALFHLYGALLGLLHEITGYYRAPQPDGQHLGEWLKEALLTQLPSPELAELIELKRSDTWLSGLLKAYERLFAAPAPSKPAKTDPRLIETLSLQTPGPDRLLVDSWKQALQELALRFREALCEH